jgi:tetratricopeptide (TPR) repeat protein
MSSRLQLAVVLFFELTASSLLQCLAETPEEKREISEANSLPDKQATIKHLDNYLLNHPNSARVVGFRAEVYNCLGRSKETIRDATRYFELSREPALPVIYKVRAHSYYKLGEYTKALHDLEAANKLDAKDGATVFLIALNLDRLGRAKEALVQYSKAIELNYYEAYFHKACLEYKINDRAAATADSVAYICNSKEADAQERLVGEVSKSGNKNLLALYDGLIEAKLAKSFVYYKRIDALYLLGKFEQVLRELDYCDEKFGKVIDSATVRRFNELRFNSYIKLGQTDKALSYANSLIAKSPNQLGLYLLRADAYFCQQNYDFALADFERVDVLVAKDRNALLNKAECRFRLGQYERAEVDLAKINSKDASVKSLTFAGLNFKALKKYREAEQCFTRALKLAPLSNNLFAFRADCHFRMKNYALCEHDLSDAITLDSKNSSFYLARGSCRLAAGNAEGAVKDLTVCLSDHNFHSVAYAARAKAYTKLGKLDLAAQDLRASGSASKAVELDLFKP